MKSVAAEGLWSSTKKVTGVLLAVWLSVNLLGPWFARDLAQLMGEGSPFGFWYAAEIALLLYLLIIVAYVVVMDRIEQRFLDQQQAVDSRGADEQ